MHCTAYVEQKEQNKKQNVNFSWEFYKYSVAAQEYKGCIPLQIIWGVFLFYALHKMNKKNKTKNKKQFSLNFMKIFHEEVERMIPCYAVIWQ